MNGIKEEEFLDYCTTINDLCRKCFDKNITQDEEENIKRSLSRNISGLIDDSNGSIFTTNQELAELFGELYQLSKQIIFLNILNLPLAHFSVEFNFHTKRYYEDMLSLTSRIKRKASSIETNKRATY